MTATGTDLVHVAMPQMGVSVAEGTVLTWLKELGDRVVADESLLEVSTDKVDTEIPSPATGTLVEILVEAGEVAPVGAVLATIAPDGVAAPVPSRSPEPERAREAVPTAAAVAQPAPAPAPPAPVGGTFVSPVVAGIALARGIDLSAVDGTGVAGRVTKRDVLAHVPTPGVTAPAPVAPVAPVVADPGETVEPMSGMRKEIASRMRFALDTVAHVTSVIEVDMTHVAAARERLKREADARGTPRPTYLAFVAHAVCAMLARYPWVNGEIRGETIVTRDHVNLGIAVELAGGTGLIVPVIRHAEALTADGLAARIADLAQRARGKKLTADDVTGATFTITNPGGYGTSHGTPIVNHPQVAILGMYSLVRRPRVVVDADGREALAFRSMMNVSLSYDHRLIDGAMAGRFLRDLRETLETWEA